MLGGGEKVSNSNSTKRRQSANEESRIGGRSKTGKGNHVS